MDTQPIDTAPRDGSEVLTYWPKLKLDDDGGMTDEVVGGSWAVTCWIGGQWDDPECLNAIGALFGDDECYADQPTHWHPLPPPPATTATPNTRTKEQQQ